MSDVQHVDVPEAVADTMVARLFENVPDPDDRILYPACGDGDLVAAVERYCDQRGCEMPRGVGVDTDSDAIARARERFCDRDVEFLERDFLGDCSDLASFDYVLGNPPVAEWGDIPAGKREEYAARFATVDAGSGNGTANRYMLYFEQAMRLVDENGRVALFTPDFTDGAGSEAENDLQRRLRDYHVESVEPVTVDADTTNPHTVDADTTNPHTVDADTASPHTVVVLVNAGPSRQIARSVNALGVQRDLTSEYDFRVGDVMTPDPEAFPQDAAVRDVHFTLLRNDDDAAPIVDADTGDCLGYVTRADLTNADGGTVDAHMTELDEDIVLPVDADFQDLLEVLLDSRCCLVGEPDRIDGIATRVDLNAVEAYLHLYSKFAEFELGLRAAIREFGVDWRAELEDAGYGHEEIEDLTRSYKRRSEMVVDELDTLKLSQLIDIAANAGIHERLGIDKNWDGIDLWRLNSLRIDVAHYQPIVHTTRNFTSGEARGAGALLTEYQFLTTCINTFHEHDYLEA